MYCTRTNTLFVHQAGKEARLNNALFSYSGDLGLRCNLIQGKPFIPIPTSAPAADPGQPPSNKLFGFLHAHVSCLKPSHFIPQPTPFRPVRPIDAVVAIPLDSTHVARRSARSALSLVARAIDASSLTVVDS